MQDNFKIYPLKKKTKTKHQKTRRSEVERDMGGDSLGE